MSKTVNSIRGMHDILPSHNGAWHFLENAIRELMPVYQYSEIRTPIVEKTELFCRSIGEVTDIVEKEMYTFPDRNGDSLSLRPENTASCVRAGIEHGLLHNTVQKMWYMGPMFRHERPQKGRYRQFHQLGVEVFGVTSPMIEAELILLSARLWRILGIEQDLTLEINSLGNAQDRQQYRENLVGYFEQRIDSLDADSKHRLHKNPLRILDSKNPDMQPLIEAAPKLRDVLSDSSRAHFDKLTELLAQNNIEYKINSRLVRGLDYYSHTVFEWVSNTLGAQGAVCAGGRYDGLITQLGGRATPGAGWASGIERLLTLIEQAHGEIAAALPHAYLIVAGDQNQAAGLLLAEYLRDAIAGLRLGVDCNNGSIKSQFKRADKSGAHLALILGDDEIASKTVSIKPLRNTGQQEQVDKATLKERLLGCL